MQEVKGAGAAVLVAMVLVVAGCGDDESTTGAESTATGTTAALTEEEFVAQANAVCAEGNKEIDAAAEEAFSANGKPSAKEEEEFITEIIVPNVQGQIDGIRELPAPAELSEEVASFLDEAQAAIDGVEADPPSLFEDDPFAELNKQAKALGLDECAG